CFLPVRTGSCRPDATRSEAGPGPVGGRRDQVRLRTPSRGAGRQDRIQRRIDPRRPRQARRRRQPCSRRSATAGPPPDLPSPASAGTPSSPGPALADLRRPLVRYPEIPYGPRMPARLLKASLSLLSLLFQIRYTLSRLVAQPLTSAFVPAFQALRDLWT